MPSSQYLPPAKLVPRLKKAISQGEVHAANDKVTESEVAEWAKDTLFVLDKIEYLALDIFEMFQRLGITVQFRRDQPIGAEARRTELLPAISALKSQVGLLEDEVESSSEEPGKRSKVFIGHGRSPSWLELQNFLRDRLHLETVEFNSVPTAGKSIIDRLKDMLDAVGFALLVMTAEDEVGDGSTRARQNVIHEIGLFQGKLGFDRAIILLEEGCDEFSNVSGLIYIGFPKGRVKAAFQDVREVLEAAGLVKPITP